jgi:hypothetical protein
VALAGFADTSTRKAPAPMRKSRVVILLLLGAIVAIVLIPCCGCTSTHYRHTAGTTEVYRISVLQGVDMRCTARPDGSVILDRYTNDGGGAQAGAAVGAAVKAGGL